jgi:hypothetical protein
MTREIQIERMELTLPRSVAAAQSRAAAETFANEIARQLAKGLAAGEHAAAGLPPLGTIHARVPAARSSAEQIAQAVQTSIARRIGSVSQKGRR